MISKQKGVLEVEVEECYFKGDGYLLQAKYKNSRTIYFAHPLEIKPGANVKLALKKYQ
jgi:hypothetical protein